MNWLRPWLVLSLVLSSAVFANPLSDEAFSETVDSSIYWSKTVYRMHKKGDQTFYDRKTGFRALVIDDANTGEIIVSFRGTTFNNLSTLASSAALNYPQFSTQAYRDTLAAVKELVSQRDGKAKVLVTGHSSGGGLAEAFSYELVSQTESQYRRDLNVNLITWNGIGSRDWFEFRDRKKFNPDPEVLASIKGYKFRSETDLVSRMGKHFIGDEWSWVNEKKGFIRTAINGHKIPASAEVIRSAGINSTRSKELSGIALLTTPKLSRNAVVAASSTVIGTFEMCRILFDATRPNLGKN